ncbi:hypothetical protein AB4264_25535 [Vibrio sp. 10N.261.55.B8]|uniref:hypothetical protein n=1 Tax=unclassified Vibrio TaxID=2614977 RepID=UPI00355415F6
MIETRYLDFEGIKPKNELAGDLAECYDLTTQNGEILDTSNDEEVDEFLRHYDYKLELYLKNGIFKIDVEIDQAGKAICVPFAQFKSAIKDVGSDEENLLITYLTDHDLISTIDISVCNQDYDERDYSLIFYKENDKLTLFLFNKDDSTLLNYDNESIDKVDEIIKYDFANLDLDTNIKLGIEEVRVKDSLELDMLKMNFIDKGFPKNNFLKITDENGCYFFNTNGEEINRSSLFLDEVDVDLLTLLKRDSEPYHKKDESVDLKQDKKVNRRSSNRPR